VRTTATERQLNCRNDDDDDDDDDDDNNNNNNNNFKFIARLVKYQASGSDHFELL
jgi:hypothetical protein